MNDLAAQRYIDFFEQLEPGSLERLHEVFTERARFVDPFNDVSGHAAIRAVFAHMFERCEQPTFIVDECLGEGGVRYLRWTFAFGSGSRECRIRGVSRVCFAADGRASEHVDYWDPASQLYESIPLLGRVLRALRRRLGTAGHQEKTTRRPDRSSATERQAP